MKSTIKIALVTLFAGLFAQTSFGQLKVDQYGRIGMGTNYPNPEFRCHIKGNLLLTNYPETPGTELRMKVNTSGTTIGSNRDVVSFWAEWVNYNKIYSAGHYTVSDSTLKSNIQPLKGSIDYLMQLTPYSYSIVNRSYDLDGNKVEEKVNKYGFMSQQVERLFPGVDITDDFNGVKIMDYDQITPLLVASVQEQQNKIDELERKVSELSALLGQPTTNEKKSVLYQNSPNPFKEKTSIKFELNTEDFQSGSILIFDLNGLLISSHAISPRDKELIIQGGELKPGMYIYSLIINDTEVDSKKMILVE